MNGNTVPRANPDIICQNVNYEMVLVSPQSGHYQVINQVGATIWGLIDGKRTISEIKRALVNQYDIPADQALQDILAFLTSLETRGLIKA
jgi:hypothetical protein